MKYSEGGSSGAPTRGGGSLQLFGKLLPQVGRGVFDPIRFVPKSNHHGSLSP